uniref:Mucolipin TRP cation channel 2 n=1 Tax=Gallus gallus TaxID=9031 RepID=A0A8V0ZFW2_CHICK
MEISLKRLPGGRAPSCGNMMAQSDLDLKETALKEDLKFYFMNPCDKYRARHQIPWKLALQILKIVMVTSQLVFFGLSNQLVVSFKEENTVAFKHLFLKGYSGVDEDDYSCSIYTQQDAYDSIFYVIDQYRQLKNISLGTLGYEHDGSGLKICKQQYRKGGMLPSNDKPNIDVSTETDCITLKPQELAGKNTEVKLNSSFFNLEFYRLLSTIELTVEKSKSILIVILIFKNAKTGTYLVLCSRKTVCTF